MKARKHVSTVNKPFYMSVTANRVLRAIGNDRLALVKGEGYWYFIYDDPGGGVFETHSVMVMRLNQMPLGDWIDEGERFCRWAAAVPYKSSIEVMHDRTR